MKPLLFFILLSFSLTLRADLHNDLKSYLSELNTYSHVDKNEIYHSQRAGYMTGGGISIRNGASQTALAQVSLPKFDAGCGGIDIFTGGISFISHDQLIAALKNIASSAQGYAFMLGIETVSPLIASTMKQMETWANAINSLGINSCEVATGLVGSVWSARTAAKQQICRSAKNGGFASSFINARHQCADEGDYVNTMQSMAKDPLYDGMLLEEYNLTWKAIQKHPFLAKKENRKMAEEIMSLTGTLIIRRDKSLVVEPWPSRIYDDSFLPILLEGGTTRVYQCTGGNAKQNCLALEMKELTIPAEQAWKGRIKQALATIQQKILADTPLASEEIDLLSKSRLPLFKIVNVLTAYKREISPISLYEVAEIVGNEMLIQYLREIIGTVRLAAIQLERGQMYDFDSQKFIEELERVEKVVSRYEERHYQRLEAENQLMLKIETLEQKIASQIILF
ncbi:conjugal transfer protein TraH [Candidatus Protochlamydia sp. R18]|uniref:conjugal transfer protein TraH n=1 Tax=Candidatus Protochlamydia sp. R18 TaxID=1353977 RepID=UPI0005AA094E|nr:conjugal transfer protein TraH [Candidatus Protochlamydia sp. R18]